MERKQYVKELPNREIELHGETETYQYPVGAITAMQIDYNDGKHIITDEQEKPPYYILQVILGYDTEDRYAERILFTAPTEEDVEKIRAEINRIRFKECECDHAPILLAYGPVGCLRRLKAWILKVIKGV